jgi:hypothetical protein
MAQTDTLRPSGEARLLGPLPKDTGLVIPRHSPYRATLLAAALPGAGQLYNRQWWKLPLLYGGTLTLAYFISYNNTFYIRYRDRTLELLQTSGTTSATQTATNQTLLQRYRSIRDNARRNRDLSIILSCVLYALNIVDASVAAHLRDFDLSDNLSLRIKPVLLPTQVSFLPVAGISLSLSLR